MSILPDAVRQLGRFRWVIIAFAAAGLLSAGIVIWQLADMTPARWCVIAKAGSPELTTGCVSILIKLLEIKGGLLTILVYILVLTIVSVVVVALGVKISGSGPGGFNVDVSADKTTVSSGGDTATIPTPPAADSQ